MTPNFDLLYKNTRSSPVMFDYITSAVALMSNALKQPICSLGHYNNRSVKNSELIVIRELNS